MRVGWLVALMAPLSASAIRHHLLQLAHKAAIILIRSCGLLSCYLMMYQGQVICIKDWREIPSGTPARGWEGA